VTAEAKDKEEACEIIKETEVKEKEKDADTITVGFASTQPNVNSCIPLRPVRYI
jgi:hypothetical protein